MDERFLRIDDDPGFFKLQIQNGEQLIEKRLDVFEQNNVIYALKEQHGQDLVAWHRAIAQHLAATFNLETPPSTAVSVRFIEYLFAVVEDVRKKLDGLPALPISSQASTPSALDDGNVQP